MSKIVTLDSLRRSKVGPDLYRQVKAHEPLKVLIGMMTPGPMVYFQTMMDLMTMLQDTRSVRRSDGRAKYGAMMGYVRATNVHTGRIDICKKAIESHADYILMLDSDMTFPPYALRQLLELDKDIVSALAVRKSFPFMPVMSRKRDPDKVLCRLDIIDDWIDGELLKVDAVGTAFMLFKTSVLKKMEKPYFHYPWNKEEDSDIGCDNYFCLKAGEVGFDVFVDTSLKIGHIGDYTATIDDYHACRAVPGKVKEAKSA